MCMKQRFRSVLSNPRKLLVLWTTTTGIAGGGDETNTEVNDSTVQSGLYEDQGKPKLDNQGPSNLGQ